jgi:hypothetical protein
MFRCKSPKVKKMCPGGNISGIDLSRRDGGRLRIVRGLSNGLPVVTPIVTPARFPVK